MILPHYSYLLAGLIPGARVKIYHDSAHGFLFQHHGEFADDVGPSWTAPAEHRRHPTGPLALGRLLSRGSFSKGIQSFGTDTALRSAYVQAGPGGDRTALCRCGLHSSCRAG